MDIGLLSSVLGILGVICTAILEIHDRIPRKYLKKAWYWVSNKKVKVKLKSIKKYPSLNCSSIKIKDLKKRVEKSLKQKQIKFEGHQFYGKNYIEFSFEDKLPYLITFEPSVSFEGEETIEDGTIVTITIRGTLEFVYREDLDNRSYLDIIEDLFKIIEDYYDVKSSFEDHRLRSTFSNFEDTGMELKTKEKNGIRVTISKKILTINSTRISSVYGQYKKNISAI